MRPAWASAFAALPMLSGVMFGNPQIHAIGDVRLESQPRHKHGVRMFYRDLIGLRELVSAPHLSQVIFHAHGRCVTVHVTADALSSPMRRRLLIQVDSLDKMEQRMRQFGFACELHYGMGVGDRRLVALDPAGNRVEMKEVTLL